MSFGEQSRSRLNTRHYLSVVIPTHGRPQGVAQVLENLCRQDLPTDSFEVLVVANFTDPELQPVLEKYRSKCGFQIRSFSAEKLGVNVARNLGLQEARGEVVLFLDDDCFPGGKKYLSRLLQLHAQYPDHCALGGGYLSLPDLNPAGRHYNWICNQWLNTQFETAVDTKRLIGGAVSYKADFLKSAGLKFDEAIQYGGTETEFHQRLSTANLRLLFHPELSVVHHPRMSSLDLVRKAYLQGFGKAKREPFAEAPRPPSFWDKLLKNTFYFNLYRRAFADGEARGLRLKPKPTRQWQFMALYVSLCVFYGLQRHPKVRKVAIDAHHALHVLYWQLYHLASESYGFIRRSIGFVKGRTLRVYGHTTGYIHAKSIRTYWTLYPAGYHLRRNWHRPWTILDEAKMPFTYPHLDLERDPVWVASVDNQWSPDKLNATLKKYSRLGIHSIELEGVAKKNAELIRAAGLKYHFLLKPFVKLDLNNFPPETEFVVVIATSEVANQLNSVIDWVRSLDCKPSLHIKIDILPQAKEMRRFLETARSERIFEHYSFEMPKPAQASGQKGFEYFRWLHRFSDQVRSLGIPWRPFYRFQQEPSYDFLPVTESANALMQLSVIVPHHRDFLNLIHVLRAICQQSLDHRIFEVIVIDNAVEEHLLTADQVDLLRKEAAGLSLKILTLKSQGPEHYLSGMARNLGVLNSTAEKILFLDSDILIPPGFLQSLLRKMETTDVIMAKRSMLNESFDPTQSSLEKIDPARHTYREDDYWEGFKSARAWSDLLDYWKYSCTYCFAVSRKSLRDSGPFDPQFMMYGFEDVDLGFRLFKKGLRFGFIEQPVFHLFPRKELHNYHHDAAKRAEVLARSALTFFLLRPEKLPFALCQGYFAPTFRNWILQPVRDLINQIINRRTNATNTDESEVIAINAP